MADEHSNSSETADSRTPTPMPGANGRIARSERQARRTPARRHEDEGVLVTSWDLTWRAVILRVADAVAHRIATPASGTQRRSPRTVGRWAVGGLAAAAAYARSRGWL